MAFDPICRWLPDSVIRRDLAVPEFLQPAPCAHADDFAFAALSFRSLMRALSLASKVIDSVAVQNLWERLISTSLQGLHTQFRIFGTYVTDNVNSGGSAILIRKNLLPDLAVVTLEITCQGRDHIVRVQSGESFVQPLKKRQLPLDCLMFSCLCSFLLPSAMSIRGICCSVCTLTSAAAMLVRSLGVRAMTTSH